MPCSTEPQSDSGGLTDRTGTIAIPVWPTCARASVAAGVAPEAAWTSRASYFMYKPRFATSAELVRGQSTAVVPPTRWICMTKRRSRKLAWGRGERGVKGVWRRRESALRDHGGNGRLTNCCHRCYCYSCCYFLLTLGPDSDGALSNHERASSLRPPSSSALRLSIRACSIDDCYSAQPITSNSSSQQQRGGHNNNSEHLVVT